MRVLIVDDERRVANTLVMILEREGYGAASAYNGAAALQKIESFIPDCVISDVLMSGMNRIRVLHERRSKNYTPLAIFCFSLGRHPQICWSKRLEPRGTDGSFWQNLSIPTSC